MREKDGSLCETRELVERLSRIESYATPRKVHLHFA